MHTVSPGREDTASATTRRRAPLGWLDPGEPHVVSGPFTRWPHIADAVLALVVFATSVVAVTASALGDGEDFTLDALADRPLGVFALLAVAAVALLWRRRRPIAVTAFVMAIMVAWSIAGYGDGQELALMVAVYAVGRYTIDHGHSLATVAVVMAVSVLDTVIDPNQRIDVVPAVVLTWLAWYLGRRVRNRGEYVVLLQERAERLEADQQARARQAVADERSRIARELHDVVAHEVSMMTVQAGAAKTIARDDLETAVAAMGDVEHAGRRALGELRHLLGVLRPDVSEHDDLGPQPGLADIAALADELTRTGADVTIAVGPYPEALSAALQLSAFRIVQESVTNILKHAGPNPTVRLAVGADDEMLAIDITNTTADVEPGLPASGYGIAGMRERAALLGGTLTAEPCPPDRFHVSARLPLESERA